MSSSVTEALCRCCRRCVCVCVSGGHVVAWLQGQPWGGSGALQVQVGKMARCLAAAGGPGTMAMCNPLHTSSHHSPHSASRHGCIQCHMLHGAWPQAEAARPHAPSTVRALQGSCHRRALGSQAQTPAARAPRKRRQQRATGRNIRSQKVPNT